MFVLYETLLETLYVVPLRLLNVKLKYVEIARIVRYNIWLIVSRVIRTKTTQLGLSTRTSTVQRIFSDKSQKLSRLVHPLFTPSHPPDPISLTLALLLIKLQA